MPVFVTVLRFIGVVIALCFCDGSSAATRLPRYGMFVYSNFRIALRLDARTRCSATHLPNCRTASLL